MAIKKYISNKDTTITNAFNKTGLYRATGSNIGAADSLEVYSSYDDVFGRQKSRVLLSFPIQDVMSDRNSNIIPDKNNVQFYLSLGNVRHAETLSENYTLVVAPISRSWDEGYGKDLDNYSDPGLGSDGLGANWIYASSSSLGLTQWSSEGGDFHDEPRYEQLFVEGDENLRVNITPLVEEWIDGTKDNFGVAIFLTSSQEDNLANASFYTKKFSARNSEYFFSRPTIEAVWDSSLKDNRNNFYVSSSMASEEDNTNTIFMYNYVRGVLKDPPTTTMYVKLFDSDGNEITTVEPNYPVTASKHSTGVLSASMVVDTSVDTFFDYWYIDTASSPVFTGEVRVDSSAPSSINSQEEWAINIKNLKPIYSPDENPRLRLYTRKRNWRPNIYNQAIYEPILNIVEDSYYKVVRLADDLEVIAYGTGSLNHTRLSYDASGSYFDFDMSLLEPGYAYEFRFCFKDNESYDEQRETFKFRVEEEIG